MIIRTIPISHILRAKYNPRKTLKPGDPAYDRLKKSHDKFGLVEPLVWNERSGVLVGGHQRLTILEQSNAIEVEVSVVDLNERDEKILNIALNKHAGEWDQGGLAALLKELDFTNQEIEIAGFDAELFSAHLNWTPATKGKTDEDAVPEPPKTPVAKPGDLWLLGKHRLLCGDSRIITDVDVLFAKHEPSLMVTDPPYGVNYDPRWRERYDNFKRHAVGKVANDDQADWQETYKLFTGSIAYVWHGGLHSSTVGGNLIACGFTLRAQIVWRKQHFVFGRGDYHWQHEPCWYAVRGTGRWTGDRKQTTIWDIQNLNPMGGNKKEKASGHGTQKPVECMRRPMANHTKPGESVYDPFIGSGTTIIAAETTGRIAYGIEIDPVYVDVAVRRWEEFTGKKAKLAK